MRLIDADEYEQRLLKMHKKMAEKEGAVYAGICFGLEYAGGYVSIAPTIDAQPVKHGKWIECDYKKLEHGFIETFPNKGVCCSNCRTAFRKRDLWIKNYCPNCGARMDKNN
ncbi:MAG: hypothetical protein NC485_14725 [Ruminococcus flavefaciens]|nr:hypothetical protein [Ruminococcus flavefaciens]